jgi:branched-chain amino acid transport system permease protein
MIVAFKADFRKVTVEGARNSYEVLGAALSADRLAGMALAILIVLALFILLKYTRMGRAIVAVRMDRDAAALMGVNVVRTYALTFAIGAALAGAAGAILSMIFPISPTASSIYLGKAFIVCVLGGLGSVPGVLVGGIALGLVESVGTVILGPDHALTLAFLLLIVLLLVRPQGIMGRKGYQ